MVRVLFELQSSALGAQFSWQKSPERRAWEVGDPPEETKPREAGEGLVAVSRGVIYQRLFCSEVLFLGGSCVRPE